MIYLRFSCAGGRSSSSGSKSTLRTPPPTPTRSSSHHSGDASFVCAFFIAAPFSGLHYINDHQQLCEWPRRHGEHLFSSLLPFAIRVYSAVPASSALTFASSSFTHLLTHFVLSPQPPAGLCEQTCWNVIDSAIISGSLQFV